MTRKFYKVADVRIREFNPELAEFGSWILTFYRDIRYMKEMFIYISGFHFIWWRLSSVATYTSFWVRPACAHILVQVFSSFLLFTSSFSLSPCKEKRTSYVLASPLGPHPQIIRRQENPTLEAPLLWLHLCDKSLRHLECYLLHLLIRPGAFISTRAGWQWDHIRFFKAQFLLHHNKSNSLFYGKNTK